MKKIVTMNEGELFSIIRDGVFDVLSETVRRKSGMVNEVGFKRTNWERKFRELEAENMRRAQFNNAMYAALMRYGIDAEAIRQYISGGQPLPVDPPRLSGQNQQSSQQGNQPQQQSAQSQQNTQVQPQAGGQQGQGQQIKNRQTGWSDRKVANHVYKVMMDMFRSKIHPSDIINGSRAAMVNFEKKPSVQKRLKPVAYTAERGQGKKMKPNAVNQTN